MTFLNILYAMNPSLDPCPPFGFDPFYFPGKASPQFFPITTLVFSPFPVFLLLNYLMVLFFYFPVSSLTPGYIFILKDSKISCTDKREPNPFVFLSLNSIS